MPCTVLPYVHRSWLPAIAAVLHALSPAAAAPWVETLYPAPLSPGVALSNPLSGLYTSLAQNPTTLELLALNPAYGDAAPLGKVPRNEYGRVSWHSLEPTQGHYEYAIIDRVLRSCRGGADSQTPPGPPCLPDGVTFGFRIMALNPQVKSDTNVTTGVDGYPVYSDLPGYLETSGHGWLLPVDPQDATQGHYFIPDWNDPVFLVRLQALLAALGARYDGDPRVGWVDIGLYGSWGEWHTAGLPDAADYTRGIPYDSSAPYYDLNTAAYQANTGQAGAYQAGTAATRTAIVDAHAAAFRRTRLIMLTDDGTGLCHALGLTGTVQPIGLRRDSLGSGANSWSWQFPDALPNCDSASDQAMILTRWQTAPFIVEPYGNGSSPSFPCQTFETDPQTGLFNILEQVPEYHLAALKNGAFCTGTWSDLTVAEQNSVLTAGLEAGYRLAPVRVELSGFRTLQIRTTWRNDGVTPAYDPWTVEFSVWSDPPGRVPAEFAKIVSRVDLRAILPTDGVPVLVTDTAGIAPERLPSGALLRLRVIDPQGYLRPMELALPGPDADGYYTLGRIGGPGPAPATAAH